jgi:hypothetical protein
MWRGAQANAYRQLSAVPLAPRRRPQILAVIITYGVPGTLMSPELSARVLVCLAASSATRALKAAECRFFVPVMMLLRMEQRSLISLTSRVVQF